jgi:flagellar motor switch protein FliM
MAMTKVLSQEEIDKVFNLMSPSTASAPNQGMAVPYDFRRPDRLPKDQLREIRLLHETFCRNAAGSLSAYLRADVTVSLKSVLQLSYVEFLQSFPSPTSICILSLKPFEGKGILEMNPSIVFPIIEILLGGQANPANTPQRETTEIEQSIFKSVIRLITKDLRDAWSGVAQFELTVEQTVTEPQLVQTLSPNEAVVAIAAEVRVGECSGLLQFVIPAAVVKTLRQRFVQRWQSRKTGPSEQELARLKQIAAQAEMDISAELVGPVISLKSLLSMQVGDTIALDYPVSRPVQLSIHGKPKYYGRIAIQRGKKAVRIEKLIPASRGDEAGSMSASDECRYGEDLCDQRDRASFQRR